MASDTERNPHNTSAELEAAAPILRERPRSFSAVHSQLSSATSSSSLPLSLPLSLPRPLSTNSSGPEAKTLVKPRAWRIVHKSRTGGSLDRERAMEEDTSLDGDEDMKDSHPRKDPDPMAGSSVDGDDVFMKNAKDQHAQDAVSEGDSEGSPVDAVVRTKSDSDIAIQKLLVRGDPRQVVFKSRAERFSHKDDKAAAQPRVTTPLSRSQTLPLSLPPQLTRVVQSQSAPQSQPTRASSNFKSQTLPLSVALPPSEAPKLASQPQVVQVPQSQPLSHPVGQSKISHGGREAADAQSPADLSPAKSDQSADSPSRNITLNVQDTTARVSFTKPAQPNKSLALTPPVTSAESLTSKEKMTPDTPVTSEKQGRPVVSAKPARRSSSQDGGGIPDEVALSPIPPFTPGNVGPPKPPRTGLDPSRRNSSNLNSPKSPVESVLFSMGFTVLDDESQPPPKTNENNYEALTSFQSKPIPKFVEASEERPRANELETRNAAEDGEWLRGTDQKPPETKSDPYYSSDWPNWNGSGDSEVFSQSKNTEIIPKKMTKIKGDKKAEEKAVKDKKKDRKAKEKEQKAKEKEEKAKQKEEKTREKEQKAREKELKAKQKAKAKEDSSHDKTRMKLFPWKVEFSAKDKAASIHQDVPDTAKSLDDEVKTDSEEMKRGGNDHSPVDLRTETTSGVQEAEEKAVTQNQVFLTATTKKTDKGDGGSSSSKSPSEKPDPSPTETPQEPSEGDQPPQGPSEGNQPSQEEAEKHEEQPQLQSTEAEKEESGVQPPPSPLPQSHQEHPAPEASQPHPPPTQQYVPELHSPTKPKHSDDLSSSDPSSDMESLSGSLRRKQGRPIHISESDGEATSQDSFQGRRLGARRHTVGGAQIKEQMRQGDDTDKKREAFYELLANRYPQYADKITGMANYQSTTTAAQRNPRPREPQRRRTTVVTYNPQSTRLLDYDDPGTMSDVEPSAFQRGGIARASLPIVRSASSSLERPIGLVFLVYGEETKKALLPNEITSLDTVRALFVRAFPEKLSMEFLDSPKRKIYILETATNIFFQLEDLRDIQDRTVLKVHECDSDEPQKVRSLPESRGRAVQQAAASSRPVSRQGYPGDFRDEMAKTQSLPVSGGHNYQELIHKERAQWEMEQEYIQAQQRRSRSRSQTPELAERPRSLSTGAPRNRYSHSPERLTTPDRGPQPLNPIPENPRLLANGFRQAALNGSHYDVLPGSHSHQPHPTGHPPPPGRVISPPPVGQPIYESVYQAGGYPHPQSYVSHSMRTALPQGPQRATGPPPEMRGNARGGPSSRHSLAFAAMSNPIYESVPQRSQSYRATPERDVLPSRPQNVMPHDVNRMERMEAQIASLAAWVHQVHASPTEPVRRGPGSSRSTSSGQSEDTDTYPGSSASNENGDASFSTSPGLSDIPAAYSLRQPVVTGDMREKIHDVHCRLHELRVELQGLKRMEQLHQETMRNAFSDTVYRIKMAMGVVPEVPKQVVHHVEADSLVGAYMQDKAKVESDLRALEVKADSMKEDVISRKCRISVSNIEGLALVLSGITKSLADLKARFPHVLDSLKKGSSGEPEVITEEQFAKEEPLQIEASLKRCKSLTNTLFTLKRLAAVQDSRSPPVPQPVAELKNADDEETMSILENIRAMVPDFDSRIQSLEAADSMKDHQRRMGSQSETYRYTRTPQAAFYPTDSSTYTEARRLSTGMDSPDSRKCDPPEVPAKPARLLSASEVKKLEESGGSSVTATSQVSDSGDSGAADRNSARSAFFSSMQSPPVSPTSVSDGGKTSSRIPTTPKSSVAVSSGPSLVLPSSSSSLTSPSHSKPVSGVYYQAVSPTRTRSAFSSIPLPNKPSPSDKEDSAKMLDKGKKVPPPPPPRKSSAKLPYGLGSGSSLSPNVNGGMGGGSGRRDSGDRSPDARQKESTLAVYKASSPTSPGVSGSKSSSSQKLPPMNKFQKDIAAGIYSNLNRPDLQHQRMAPDRLLTSMASPAPAAVVTNSQDPQEEGDLSGSESTGSSTSLDSQQGVALLRANSSASRGPKPHPPQRHSSLSSKSFEDSAPKTKTQMLQERVRKSQEASGKKGGGTYSQVNGLDGARNGHKT